MNVIVSVGKQNKTFEAPWQSHGMWELFECTNGSGCLQTKTKTLEYTHGDLVLIAPNVPFCATSKTGYSALHIGMDNMLLSAEGITKMHETTAKLVSTILNQIYYVYNNELPNKALLMQSYGDLIANLLISLTNTEAFSPAVDHIRMECVRHFTEADLDLNLLFEQEHSYNANYLKKLFKKEVGLSPQQFLISLRMNFAQKLFSNVGQNKYSVSQIALTCGYEDPLYFSRVFKESTGYSPKAYVEAHRSNAQ